MKHNFSIDLLFLPPRLWRKFSFWSVRHGGELVPMNLPTGRQAIPTLKLPPSPRFYLRKTSPVDKTADKC